MLRPLEADTFPVIITTVLNPVLHYLAFTKDLDSIITSA